LSDLPEDLFSDDEEEDYTVLNVLYSGNAVLCVIASPAIQASSPPISLPGGPVVG
jgi:hypothetical protein